MEPRDAASEIAGAFAPDIDVDSLHSFLDPFIDALSQCLLHDEERLEYMEDLMRFAGKVGSAIATLNYDLVVESALDRQKLTYDYGLSSWNKRKVVRWTGADVKLMKLHGSINWTGNMDNVDIDQPDKTRRNKPVMIFGSLHGKLTPEGPFLPLRHEFERDLRQTNILAIIGYSFRDAHMNALIRRWVSTRRRAKLVVADPADRQLGVDVIGYPFISDDRGSITKYTVEIVHIKKPTRLAVEDIVAACESPPDPERAYRDRF